MDYLQIEKEIASKQIILLSGDEKFLMEEIIRTFIKRWIPQAYMDFNLVYLKEDVKENQVLDACMTLPLMDERKLVVVKDVESFVNDQNLSKDFYKELEDLREGTLLIFMESKKALDKRTKLYKTIKKLGKVIPCQSLNRQEVSQFLKRQNKGREETSLSVIQYFVDMMGYLQGTTNLLELKLEWEKILLACQGRPVGRKDVDFFLAYEKEKNIFAFTDAFVNKDIKKTFEAIESLKEQNMDIYQLLGLLNRQIENLYRAKILVSQGYREQDLRQRMGLHPFVAKKLFRQVNQYKLSQLKAMLDRLIFLDQDLKTLSVSDQYLFEGEILKMMTENSL